MKNVVNQGTLIPLGLAVAIIGSAAMWVSDISNQIKFNSGRIDFLSKSNEDQVKLIYEVNSRLSRIEWRLEVDKVGRDRKN